MSQDANMLVVLTIILVQRSASSSDDAWDGPGRFTHEDEVNRWQHRHLINMTENICKDTTYKLRQSDLVQTAYKHTIGYELGMLACGIMEKFKHMIRVYRYYSNPKMFQDHQHNIDQIMNAYSVLQSDYTEMIAEIVLYYEVLEEHRQQQAAVVQRARVYAKKHKMAVQDVLNLMNKGIDIEKLHASQLRRSMPTDSPSYDEAEEHELLEELGMVGNKTQYPNDFPAQVKLPGKNIFAKKNNSYKEAEYKKKLRYIMWAEKWDGYNPATEGVHIDETIAKLGLNESDYLLKELRADF